MIGSRTSVGGCEKIPDASVSKIQVLWESLCICMVCVRERQETENVWNWMGERQWQSVYLLHNQSCVSSMKPSLLICLTSKMLTTNFPLTENNIRHKVLRINICEFYWTFDSYNCPNHPDRHNMLLFVHSFVSAEDIQLCEKLNTE